MTTAVAPEKEYDAIVVGVGGMGSAVAYHLAARGYRVLAIEQFGIPHERGSSHGLTRIIRLAYFEHPAYVPLLRRAYTLWNELSAAAGETLLHITGSLDIDRSGGALVEGSRHACVQHGLAHEVLTGPEVSRRFPGYALPADLEAVFQPDGGYLLSERAIVAHAARAQSAGADIHVGERVLAWGANDGTGLIRVRTDKRTYETARLALTAGAWTRTLVPRLRRVAVPERQVVGWFRPSEPALFFPSRFPVFNMRVPEGTFYGIPMEGIPGLKVGRWHHLGEIADADAMDRSCHPEDEQVLRTCVDRYFPRASGRTLALTACLFTNTPDEHFIIDEHPDHPGVFIAAGFSGHGYKFCSVVGEIMADLITSGRTAHDIGMFQLARLGPDASVRDLALH